MNLRQEVSTTGGPYIPLRYVGRVTQNSETLEFSRGWSKGENLDMRISLVK